MYLKNFLIFVLFLFITLQAQTRRIVLLEEATNASCSPCAYYNPGLQNFYANHFGGVISVRYHAWWPGTDPMYQSAKDDCINRIHYYNINGVPNYVMDGKLEGVPADPSAMEEQMKDRLAKPSPLKIHIKAFINEDSVQARVTLIPVDTIKVGKLYLRVAITQRMVSYAYPPGSNGEKDFAEVLRKMLPNAVGTFLDSLAMGDTLTFTFSTPVKNDWESGDLGIVAWVQSDLTKEILQAAMHFPTTVISNPNPEVVFLNAQQTNSIPYFIVNDTPDTVHVTLMLKNKNAAADWSFSLKVGEQLASQIPLEILPGDTAHFDLQVQTGASGTGSITVFSENDDDDGFYGEGYGYGYGVKFQGVVPQNSDILLVDDDGGKSYENNFKKILDANGYKYICVDEAYLNELSQNTDLNIYKLIIWNVSWAFPAFSSSDVQLFEHYLQQGGNAIVFGQDVAWDVFDSTGQSHFAKAEFLLKNYFGVQFLEDNSKGTKMYGIKGDPIGDGLSFELARPYGFNNLMPDALQPLNQAQAIFTYNNGKFGALRFDNDTSRTVFYGISFEEIDGDAARENVLLRSIEWVTGETALKQGTVLPLKTALLGNYPNPFNPSTTIRYELSIKDHVEISIYNALGQKIKTLVNEWQQPGRHQVSFKASRFASGIYFYRLKTSHGFSAVHKMILLR